MRIEDKITEYLTEGKMTPDFQKAFDLFFKGCLEIVDEYWKRNKYTHDQDAMSYTVGRRYVKVIQGTSVHTFIDLKEGPTYGDVLKPASWNAPAKKARGNIFDKDNGLKSMGPHGPAYLK